MKKKYKILKNMTITIDEEYRKTRKLYCIQALRDFGDVKKGDLGGYVEEKDNLSQEGDCWIYDNGKAYRGAQILENAKVHNNVEVISATMKGNSCAYDDAIIYKDAIMEDYAKAYGEARVGGSAHLKDYACVYDKAVVNGYVIMQDYTKAYGHSWVSGHTQMNDYASSYEDSKIFDNAQLGGNSKAYGKSIVKGDTVLLNSEVYENITLTTGCYENETIPLPKYELTDETITINGHTLYRIRALRDFGDVKVGDLGGFIENETNLSHQGNCWVYDNAKVFEKAQVFNDGKVIGNAKVCGKIMIKDFAQIKDNVIITGGGLIIKDYAEISENVYLIASNKHCSRHFISNLHNEWDYSYNEICGTASISGNIKVICEGHPTQITGTIRREEDLEHYSHFKKTYIPTANDLNNLKRGISKLCAFSELIDKKNEYLNKKSEELLNENNSNKNKEEHDLNKMQFFKERIKKDIEDAAMHYKTVLFLSDEEFAIFCDEAKSIKYVFSENEYGSYIQEFGAFSKEDEKNLLKKEIIKIAETINNFKIIYDLAAKEKENYISAGKEDIYNKIYNDITAKEEKAKKDIYLTVKSIGVTEVEVKELLATINITPEMQEKAKEMYANIKVKAYSEYNKASKIKSQNKKEIEI